MFFCNVKNNSKARKMTSLKIVMAIVVVIAINHWSFLNNIFNIFNSGVSNLLSFTERFILDIMNIGKLVSTSCTVYVGLGAMFVKLAFLVMVAFVLFLPRGCAFRENSQGNNVNHYNDLTLVEFATNDIYLRNNKFIC